MSEANQKTEGGEGTRRIYNKGRRTCPPQRHIFRSIVEYDIEKTEMEKKRERTKAGLTRTAEKKAGHSKRRRPLANVRSHVPTLKLPYAI